MLKTRMLRRAALVLTLIATVSVVGGPPALADTYQCTPSGCAGKARFVSYGEHLYVDDLAADGHSVVVIFLLEGNSSEFQAWNPNGKGSTVDRDLDMAEGRWISYYVCLGEYGTRQVLSSTCSPGTYDIA